MASSIIFVELIPPRWKRSLQQVIKKRRKDKGKEKRKSFHKVEVPVTIFALFAKEKPEETPCVACARPRPVSID